MAESYPSIGGAVRIRTWHQLAEQWVHLGEVPHQFKYTKQLGIPSRLRLYLCARYQPNVNFFYVLAHSVIAAPVQAWISHFKHQNIAHDLQSLGAALFFTPRMSLPLPYKKEHHTEKGNDLYQRNPLFGFRFVCYLFCVCPCPDGRDAIRGGRRER